MIFLLHLGRDRLQIGTHSLHRDPRFHSCQGGEQMSAPVLREGQVVAEGRPCLHLLGKRESHRHYSGDQMRLSMESDNFADDFSVRCEMMLPQSIAEKHCAGGVLVKLVCGESRPEEWGHGQQREEILGNECSVDLLRRRCLPRVAQVLRKNTISGDLGKHAIALSHIAKCCPGDIHRALMDLLQTHDLAGLMQGQRVEQDRIYHAEYRGVRPNSKRYGHHCHGGEGGRLPQHTKLVAQILKQSFHGVHSRPNAASLQG